ncbi:MAG: HAMP domain-containing histidine kinase [Flavobacterium sp.]|nr:HAMP domain-containing histidine kinase [Flavobacterium sp.]
MSLPEAPIRIMTINYKPTLLTSVSLFTIILALSVITGWFFNVAILQSIVPGFISMKINTAICFLFSGILLMCLKMGRWNNGCRLMAFFILAFGVATFSQNIFNYNLGIDQLLITDYDAIKNGLSYPGRPSPTAAFCFSLYGFALLGITSHNLRLKKLAQYSLHLITLISFIALLGYLFSVAAFYKLAFLTNIAFHTALAFFMLSIATSFIQKHRGITGIFTGTNIGNLLARKLFPKITISIILLTLLELYIIRQRMISEYFGIVLLGTSFIIVTLYFIASTSRQLNRIDIKRIKAENKIIKTNKNLEKIVHDRTIYLTNQNKQLEDFTHIISHNLRGPVSNLNSLLDFYKEGKTIEEKDEMMKMLEKTVNNIGNTLNELLEVVSIRHQSKKDREKVDFETIFSKMTETFQGQILKSKAIVTADFSRVPQMKYSSTYLESIMQNLLSNALKYSSPKRNPVIHFETNIFNNNFVMTVSDNGLGIDLSKNKSHIFGLHKTFHKHPEAKGIGLFLTKAQVEAMGGEISITSKLNEGTTFKIVFIQKPVK